METDQQVARTILEQLGGPGFRAMIGMKLPAVSSANGVGFAFKAKARNRINAVRITLTPMDTYTVEFLHASAHMPPRIVTTREDIYCDSLVDVFESVTGLAARMPRFVRGG